MTRKELAKNRSNNYAAIDIGSNAVRLLIKHADEEEAEVKFSKVLMLRVHCASVSTYSPPAASQKNGRRT